MLVPAAAFEPGKGESKRPRLTMSRMAHANDMRILGDMTLGTTPPLSFVFEFDTSVEQPRNGQELMLKISEAYWTSQGKRIDDPIEQRIATFLSFYGNWQDGDQDIQYDGERIARVEMPLYPSDGDHEEVREQGFAVIGSLSSMYSSHYLRLITNNEGEQHRLSAKTKAGFMGRLIPEPYKGKVLHLWRMILVPGWPEREEEPRKEIGILA